MIAIFYESDKKQIKTVHFGATGYLDYTIAPHDEERRKDISKGIKTQKTGTIICLQALYQDIYLWEFIYSNTALNTYFGLFNFWLFIFWDYSYFRLFTLLIIHTFWDYSHYWLFTLLIIHTFGLFTLSDYSHFFGLFTLLDYSHFWIIHTIGLFTLLDYSHFLDYSPFWIIHTFG